MPRLHDILTIFLIFVRDREVVVGEQDAAREAGVWQYLRLLPSTSPFSPAYLVEHRDRHVPDTQQLTKLFSTFVAGRSNHQTSCSKHGSHLNRQDRDSPYVP